MAGHRRTGCLEIVTVAAEIALGDEEVGHGSTEHLVTRPSEEQLGLPVPLGEHAVGIGFDKGVAGQVEEVLEAVTPTVQTAMSSVTLGTGSGRYGC